MYGPDATLADVRDFESNEDWVPTACVAPDYLHKGDISGGPPYSVELGRSCADAPISGTPYERGPSIFLGRQSLLFVTYLRTAILAWGGFPGFRRSPDLLPTDTRRLLTADRTPF